MLHTAEVLSHCNSFLFQHDLTLFLKQFLSIERENKLMREAFKTNAPLWASQVLSSTDQVAALPHLPWELERKTRGDSLHSGNAQCCLRQPRGLCTPRDALFATQMKTLLEARQEISFTSPKHRWHACLYHTTHQQLKSGRCHLESPQCHFQSTSFRQKTGRASGCQHTKGAGTHESSGHWQTLELAKAEQ